MDKYFAYHLITPLQWQALLLDPRYFYDLCPTIAQIKPGEPLPFALPEPENYLAEQWQALKQEVADVTFKELVAERAHTSASESSGTADQAEGNPADIGIAAQLGMDVATYRRMIVASEAVVSTDEVQESGGGGRFNR